MKFFTQKFDNRANIVAPPRASIARLLATRGASPGCLTAPREIQLSVTFNLHPNL